MEEDLETALLTGLLTSPDLSNHPVQQGNPLEPLPHLDQGPLLALLLCLLRDRPVSCPVPVLISAVVSKSARTASRPLLTSEVRVWSTVQDLRCSVVVKDVLPLSPTTMDTAHLPLLLMFQVQAQPIGQVQAHPIGQVQARPPTMEVTAMKTTSALMNLIMRTLHTTLTMMYQAMPTPCLPIPWYFQPEDPASPCRTVPRTVLYLIPLMVAIIKNPMVSHPPPTGQNLWSQLHQHPLMEYPVRMPQSHLHLPGTPQPQLGTTTQFQPIHFSTQESRLMNQLHLTDLHHQLTDLHHQLTNLHHHLTVLRHLPGLHTLQQLLGLHILQRLPDLSTSPSPLLIGQPIIHQQPGPQFTHQVHQDPLMFHPLLAISNLWEAMADTTTQSHPIPWNCPKGDLPRTDQKRTEATLRPLQLNMEDSRAQRRLSPDDPKTTSDQSTVAS
jgi:hypothetical protein